MWTELNDGGVFLVVDNRSGSRFYQGIRISYPFHKFLIRLPLCCSVCVFKVKCNLCFCIQFKWRCNFTSVFVCRERVLLNPSFWLFTKKLKHSLQMEVFKTFCEKESVNRYWAQVHVPRIERLIPQYTRSQVTFRKIPFQFSWNLHRHAWYPLTDCGWGGERRPLSATRMFSKSRFFKNFGKSWVGVSILGSNTCHRSSGQ